MVENMIDALENLNIARARFSLEPIGVRWHNSYFRQDDILEFLRRYFAVESIDNFASSYYLISRTLNAAIALNRGEVPDYNSEINWLASKLPPLGDFSPVKMIICKKK